MLIFLLALVCLPVLILLEYLFEASNVQTVVLWGYQLHSPVHYLERMENRTKKVYSSVGNFTARALNYSYSLNIPGHLCTFWKCAKRITHMLFRAVMPFEDFRKEFAQQLNPSVAHTSPKILRVKRSRQSDESNESKSEDLTRATIFNDVKSPNTDILDKLQQPSTKTLDETTKEEIDLYTGEEEDPEVYESD